MKYQLEAISRQGDRDYNEDSYGYADNGEALLLMLADGMGGHAGGKLASEIFIEVAKAQFSQHSGAIAKPLEFLRHTIATAHEEINQAGARLVPPVSPRTTCVLCLVQNNQAWWAHLGDSRLYLFRHGEILYRTRDHSRVEELVQLGMITTKEALVHPQRNHITRCLGGPTQLHTITVSEAIPLEMGDIILLCSDGLWNNLRTKAMMKYLNAEHLDDVAIDLVSSAEKNGHPKCDNVTVMVMRWLSRHNSTPVLEKTQPAALLPQQSEPEPEPEKDQVTEAIEALQLIINEYQDEIKKP